MVSEPRSEAAQYQSQATQFWPQQQQQYGAPPSSGIDEVRTLWIGDLQYWMDENYLKTCFYQTGELLSAEVIRNKQTGQSEGYGFLEFRTRATAEDILQIYNVTTMPNAEQAYQLKWATHGEKWGDFGIKNGYSQEDSWDVKRESSVRLSPAPSVNWQQECLETELDDDKKFDEGDEKAVTDEENLMSGAEMVEDENVREAVDDSKLDEPVNVGESEGDTFVKEEPLAGGIEGDTKFRVGLSTGNNVGEETKLPDTEPKTRSDVGEPIREDYDSADGLQDEEEEALSLYMKLDIKSLLHEDDLEENGIKEVDMDTEDDFCLQLPKLDSYDEADKNDKSVKDLVLLLFETALLNSGYRSSSVEDVSFNAKENELGLVRMIFDPEKKISRSSHLNFPSCKFEAMQA